MLRQQQAETPQAPPSRNESDLLLLSASWRAIARRSMSCTLRTITRCCASCSESPGRSSSQMKASTTSCSRSAQQHVVRAPLARFDVDHGIAYHKALKALASRRRWSSRFGFCLDDF
jgi:hypothetical protein